MLRITLLTCTLLISSTMASAGVLDPDCTAKKAAKSTAMKATVGVGGRCDPKEAATDTTKNALDLDEKDKKRKKKDKDDDDSEDKGLVGKTTKKVLGP